MKRKTRGAERRKVHERRHTERDRGNVCVCVLCFTIWLCVLWRNGICLPRPRYINLIARSLPALVGASLAISSERGVMQKGTARACMRAHTHTYTHTQMQGMFKPRKLLLPQNLPKWNMYELEWMLELKATNGF